MPFNRPTPVQIRDRVAGEYEAVLPGADARTRRSVEGVSARALTVASVGLHDHIDWVAEQILVDKAEEEFVLRHASLWGIERRGASGATGKIRFTGLTGATIEAGTELRRSDDARYVTLADAVLATVGGQVIAEVMVAAVVAGQIGDAPTGTKLSLISPVPDVQSQAIVIDDGSGAGLTNGADIERVEDLRARVIARIQQPPQGGADYDYIAWALEVPGVARGKVWVYPGWMGLGTVGVAFLVAEGDGYRIPSATEVAAVQAHIDSRRPVTAEVIVFAPTPYPVGMAIKLFPDTVATRAAVVDELTDFFLREGVPGSPIYLSRLRAAISVAVGEDHHELIDPVDSIMPPAGRLPVLGEISWPG
ncbi:MAG: baseplate J/gp47 family protein [Nevskiaceae bacterium]|nr:MAG: baseplate J/gp47 family protein [Nevskiaceae bacterium]